MATIAAATATEPEGDQCVVMRGVDWKGYLAMLRIRGERARPRIVYLDGDLYLMSPAYVHEHFGERFGLFVMEVAVGLRIPCTPAGSTTFRRRKRRGGVEGDKTFYLGNAARIRGKKDLHLRRDPPPDLAVEVVNTHAAAAAVEAWRRFHVPEVWVCDANERIILIRQPDGSYRPSPTSLAFPFLSAAEIFEWINRPQTATEMEWTLALRQWIADVVAPRARALGPLADEGRA